ncbi:hypothetical protein GCM10023142_05390 [Anaerocolumna aminovalerica]
MRIGNLAELLLLMIIIFQNRFDNLSFNCYTKSYAIHAKKGKIIRCFKCCRIVLFDNSIIIKSGRENKT